MNKIAVINSITPIKKDDMKVDEDYSEKDYQKFLLDRQFLNYPFILTTHVSVFETIFSTKRCSAISFYQLCGSVIVLDEIQSYKNKIWTEIMYFLQAMSKVLNIKVVIMSATLPNLEYLTGKTEGIVNLITNRNRYFEDERFKSRVKISYELLNKQIDDNELIEHILKNASEDINIVIEFISKKRAYDIYDKIKEMVDNQIEVLCLTGDYNQFDRENTIEKISNSKGNILVATQVIEAGVDIDMDIGYKDISKLDSEEQFIGRINRNYDEDKKKYSIVYFFDMDKEKRIYKEDLRVENDLSIRNEEVQDILLTKDFNLYYKKVMDYIKKIYNDRLSGEGVNEFFNNLKKLEYSDIEKRMKLIEDDKNLISIFLNIKDNKPSKDGEELCGESVWKEYKKMLSDNSIEYAEKQVRLSEIRSKMNYFIYQTRKRISKYDEVIGELYYIKEGDSYIKDGHFSMENNDFI